MRNEIIAELGKLTKEIDEQLTNTTFLDIAKQANTMEWFLAELERKMEQHVRPKYRCKLEELESNNYDPDGPVRDEWVEREVVRKQDELG